MKKIAVFTGSRADYGLLSFLMEMIDKSDKLELKVIASGSHLSPEFGSTYKEIEQDGFFIDEKIEMLVSSDSASGVSKSVGLAVISFTDCLVRMQPDVLVILGDRFEAFAMAQAAFFQKIPILHIHGGEKTEGAIDDVIRHSITKMSLLHCTANKAYQSRVIQLGEHPSRVYNVGAIGLDNIYLKPYMNKAKLSEILNFNFEKPFFLVTYHPCTLGNEVPELVVKNLISSLSEFSCYNSIITYPSCDEGGRKIFEILQDFAKRNKNSVRLVESLGSKNYLNVMKHAELVIGNSSSGIIEAPAFRVPTINIGIRQQGRLMAKSVVNASTGAEEIKNAIFKGLDLELSGDPSIFENPYGSSGASETITGLLETFDFSKVKSFYDISR